MSNKIIFKIFFLYTTLCSGQINYPYLIGVTGDNNGRIEYLNETDKVFNMANFYNKEKKIFEIVINHLDENLSRNEYKILKDDRDPDYPITYLNSKLLHNNILNFYNKLKSFEYEGVDDELYRANYLSLKKRAFKTELHKESFLKGTFERNGGVMQDGIFFLLYANSGSHYETALKILKKNKSDIVSFYSNNKTIPSIKIIMFNPTEHIKTKLLNSLYNKLAKCEPCTLVN